MKFFFSDNKSLFIFFLLASTSIANSDSKGLPFMDGLPDFFKRAGFNRRASLFSSLISFIKPSFIGATVVIIEMTSHDVVRYVHIKASEVKVVLDL
jgi:hypothetical protein